MIGRLRAERRLVSGELRQGDRSVTDFSIEFRTLAAECRWNSEAQWDMFFHGLADYVKDEIYTLELPTSLDGLVSLAIRVDARLQQRGQRARRASADNRLDHLPIPYRDADISFAEPEPMQMGRPRLSWRRSGGGVTRVFACIAELLGTSQHSVP